MSIQSLLVFKNTNNRSLQNVVWLVRQFSRKSNKNSKGSYVTVRSRGEAKNDSKLARLDPNFELLAPRDGYPFILPGNVGMAWYDTNTTARSRCEFVMEQIDESHTAARDIICRIQTCPTVLRKSVCDLFPYRDLESSELSVVTISLKPNLKLLRKNKELETERLAQTFVITAKNVCDRLHNGGYWADFINPFSGRPYLCPTTGAKLYEADEKFRCLDFQIFDIKNCKIVSNEQNSLDRLFIGSLFTNAPSKKNHLNQIFAQL